MTDMVRALAAGVSTMPGGAATAALGIRPNPGALPLDDQNDLDPVRFNFPWATNQVYTPRSGFGTPFSILRGLAATSPVVGLCIQCRKDQMSSLDWDFALRDKAARKALKAKPGAADPRVTQARQFFAKPDRITPFRTWLETMVDEILTIDALSIYRRRTRGGQMFGYEIKDGSTFKVLIDTGGNVPLPPNVAYRQIINGAPMIGGDCTVDELMYCPKTVRTWTPYGMSPLEMAMLIITADLNRSTFNLSYYTEGNIPEALVGVPDSWSPKQIKQFQVFWDLVLKGDPKNRSRLRFVAQAMAKSVHEFKKPDFTTAYDLWLLKLTCACYGVTPSEIGFTDDVNKATSKSQGDVNQRRGVKPMANFIKAILDTMLVEIGLDDLETTFQGGEGEDALSQAKIQDLKLRNGSLTLDEVRIADGNEPVGITEPCIVTATGPVKWDSINDPPPEPPTIVHALPPAPGDPDGPKPVKTTQQLAAEADLKKYFTVATKAVKAGKSVPVFSSAAIPAPTLARLSRALAAADSLDDVKAVFKRVSSLTATQKKHQAGMAAAVSGVLAAQGRALVKHVAAGVEAHG